jgi:hypothetical protein
MKTPEKLGILQKSALRVSRKKEFLCFANAADQLSLAQPVEANAKNAVFRQQ